MDESTPSSTSESRSPIALIRDLQSGALSPTALSPDARRACVEHFTSEGCSNAEIAEMLKVAPRTVSRDLREIRQANAIHRDPGFVDESIGELVQQARQSILRLRRTSRERDCPHAVRVEADRHAWAVAKELAEILQRLGILPTAPQELRADLMHRMENPPSVDELLAELDGMAQVLGEVEHGEEVRAHAAELRAELLRSKASEGLRLVAQALGIQESKVEGDGDSHAEGR